MARNRRQVLGIEIDGGQVRIVEMQRGAHHPTITAAHVAELPDGTMSGGVVMRPETLAEVILKALDEMGATTRNAVIGLSASVISMRAMDVPDVPEAELQAVVEGEVQHFQILREEGGVFDFWPLKPTSNEEGADRQVLLMAIEESVLGGYREALERAGVSLDAIEAQHIGMFRSAGKAMEREGASCVLTIGASRSEIGMVISDEVCLYRRIEIGAMDMIADELTGDLRESVVSTLATELKRSIDYFHREYPNAPIVEKVIGVIEEPHLTKLPEMLIPVLRADVEIVTPPDSSAASPEVSMLLDMPEGCRYLGAIGLAMEGIDVGSSNMPMFDFAASGGRSYELKSARRNFMLSGAAAAALLVIGGGLSFFLNSRNNHLDAEISKLRAEINTLQEKYRPQAEAKAMQLEIVRDLTAQGVPFQPLMDALTAALDPSVGLEKVSVDTGGVVNFTAEATDELAMINTVERLRSWPYFSDTIVNNYGKMAENEPNNPAIRFDLTTRYVGTFARPNVPAGDPGATIGDSAQ
jgi:type IV pilus assembly protein PilM